MAYPERFILKPAGNGTYAEASRRAMVSYAQSIRPVNAEMANQLLAWVEHEEFVNRNNRAYGYPKKGE